MRRTLRSPALHAAAIGLLLVARGARGACPPADTWTFTMDAASSNDQAYGAGIDASGSVYVAGYDNHFDLGQAANFTVRKFAPGGALIWMQSYNGPASDNDWAFGAAVDSQGSVIAAGYEWTGMVTYQDWVIRKYDHAGNLVWHRNYDGPAGTFDLDTAYAVATGPADVVAVAGSEWHATENENWRIILYDAAGTILWSRSLNGPADGSDRALGVACDAAGNVIVVGRWDDGTGPSWDWNVAKFGPTGALLWSRTHDGGAGAEEAQAVATDAAGNVYVGGAGGSGSQLRSWAPDGTFRWSAAAAGSWDGVAVDGCGHVAVAGTVSGIWTARKYTGAGTLIWSATRTVSGPYVNGVTTGPAGEVVVAGAFSGNALDWRVERLDPDTCAASVCGAISATLVSGSCTVSIGQSWPVVLTAGNAGSAPLGPVTAGLWPSGGTAGVSLSGPAPATAGVLGPGATIAFTWTVTAVSAGTIAWTGTAAAAGGIASALAVSCTVLVQTPPFLESRMTVGGTAWCAGESFPVTLTVSNAGQATAAGVAPPGPATIGPVVIVAGPPAVPVAIPGGGSVSWTWTLQGSIAGSGGLTASVTGTDANSGAVVQGSPATATTLIVSGPALAAALSLPALPVAGRACAVRFTVTGTGDLTSAPGTAALVAGPGSLTATPVTLPVPALAPGATVTLEWTVTPVAAGGLCLAATASTTGCGAAPLTTNAAACATVLSPAVLVIDQVTWTPATVSAGWTVTATAIVRNAGEADAVLESVTAQAAASGPAVLGPAGIWSPSFPLALPGGAAVAVSWSYPTGTCGTATLTVSATGREADSGWPLGAAPVSGTALQVAGAPTTLSIVAEPGATVTGGAGTVIVTVTDDCVPAGPVPGLTVSLRLTSGDGTLAAAAAVTDGAGRAAVSFRAGAAAGPVSIAAGTAGGLSATAWITVLAPGPPPLGRDGAALDRNVFSPSSGDRVLVRVRPRDGTPLTILIFTASGRLVRSLRDEASGWPGERRASWDGLTGDGFPVARGVYLVVVEGGGVSAVLKVVVR